MLDWIKGKLWVFGLALAPIALLWRWLFRRKPNTTINPMTPDQADAARDRIKDARDAKLAESQGRWDDLREKWVKWSGERK